MFFFFGRWTIQTSFLDLKLFNFSFAHNTNKQCNRSNEKKKIEIEKPKSKLNHRFFFFFFWTNTFLWVCVDIVIGQFWAPCLHISSWVIHFNNSTHAIPMSSHSNINWHVKCMWIDIWFILKNLFIWPQCFVFVHAVHCSTLFLFCFPVLTVVILKNAKANDHFYFVCGWIELCVFYVV